MLARLEATPEIEAAYLAREGREILMRGAPKVSATDVVAACDGALLASTLRSQVLSEAKARAAWAERDTDAWLPRAELWKLSWREAEAFADRLLKVLQAEVGGPVATLRPILVESFFEGVRPKDGSGPISRRWPKGAKVAQRRGVLMKAAREHLTAAQVEALTKVLSDKERVRAIVATGGG